MPVVNGKVVAPIDFIGTIAAVLGSTSGDIGTLCTDPNVNKWSKHKPVRGSVGEYTSWDKNTGNVRAEVSFPIVWGMKLPFNTLRQLNIADSGGGTRYLKPLAWRAAHRHNATSEYNIQNYVYCPPVVGQDAMRSTDFENYNSRAPIAWTTGVSGAEDKASVSGYSGSTGLDLKVDTFDTATVDFYLGRPTNADISFKDLFNEQRYRFFIELYKNDSTLSNADSDDPEAIIVSMHDLSQMDFGVNFSVPVSRIRAVMGLPSVDGSQKIMAVLGVNQFTSVPSMSEERTADNKGLGYAILTTSAQKTAIAQGAGSIAPWTTNSKPFICDIEFRSYSKITVYATAYAGVTSSSYSAMPSTTIQYYSDGIRLKTTVTNKGTSSFVLGDSAGKNRLQIQARGNFDTSVPSYSSMCLSPTEGKWHNVTISPYGNFSSVSPITIGAGATNSAVYMQCLGFMPIGITSAFTMRVSIDYGQTWVITASFSGGFDNR